MPPFLASRRNGKIVLEIDELQFLSDALRRGEGSLSLVDRDAFLEFALQHVFTLSHDIDANGAHPSWWQRLSEALGNAAASAGRGLQRSEIPAPTCGCDPEEHDGG